MGNDLVQEGGISLMTANITSLHQRWTQVQEWGVDVLLLQETKLSEEGQRRMVGTIRS